MIDFRNCFAALNGDHEPFPWQEQLFDEAMHGRWPGSIQLPTASGKTALIDIAVLALGAGAPQACRRVAFVVDRRVVVDEAAQRSTEIAKRLCEAVHTPSDCLHPIAKRLCDLGGGGDPLVVATLRGGIQPDDSWARSPAQPAVILSTVDQVGSRLLFRAYGDTGPRSWPIHAGLLGMDCLLIVDEAHCSQPFCETVQLIAQKYQSWAEAPLARPLRLVRMSATPGDHPDFTLTDEDYEHPELSRRMNATKPAKLVLVDANDENQRQRLVSEIVRQAEGLLDCARVVGVVVNRVADARTVFDRLNLHDDQKLLLTGRVRGWERDRLLARWLPRLRAGSRQATESPIAVIATQCIEVGANLDFDALVTEVAALDALRQRFGRLNRLGQRHDALGAVVATTHQVAMTNEDTPRNVDPVYGEALARTWAWLWDNAKVERSGSGKRTQERRFVDFGIAALSPRLPEGDELAALCTPTAHAPVLLPAHLDLLVQTSPVPDPSPDAAPFLHGFAAGPADVTVVWRADLPKEDPDCWADRVAVQPPVLGEGCPVRFGEVRRWLAESRVIESGSDLEGRDPAEEDEELVRIGRGALRWRGADDAELIHATPLRPGDTAILRPGDTIVVPAAYGGCDAFGWIPASGRPVRDVRDIGDAVAYFAERRPVLRLAPEVLRGWLSEVPEPAPIALLRTWAEGNEGSDEIDPRDALSALAADTSLPDDLAWLRGLATRLHDDKPFPVSAAGAPALVGRKRAGRDVSTAEDRSALTQEVSLEAHSQGVQAWSKRFAEALGVPESLRDDLSLAGWLHDVGKADPRFQVLLHAGDEIAAAMSPQPLAKSAANARNRTAQRRARERAGYPVNCRHEVLSLALVQDAEPLRPQGDDWDLVLHLVASHHGFCRPLAPAVFDEQPVDVELAHGGVSLAGNSAHGLHSLDRGIPDRFWRLVRKYGWWGLAWLEACLRLADHRRSEEEEHNHD